MCPVSSRARSPSSPNSAFCSCSGVRPGMSVNVLPSFAVQSHHWLRTPVADRASGDATSVWFCLSAGTPTLLNGSRGTGGGGREEGVVMLVCGDDDVVEPVDGDAGPVAAGVLVRGEQHRSAELRAG